MHLGVNDGHPRHEEIGNGYRVELREEVDASNLTGLSGITGDITGPHLHFEIRDPNGAAINPLIEYHPDDARAGTMNDNPVFIIVNGRYTFNPNFEGFNP
jgi:murein DD-endopeptidase MepM/ murein hydrolase activator NlpD